MSTSIGYARAVFAACTLVLCAPSALAETIPVEGVYAPRTDIPADVELIVVDRFGGDLGTDVELALTDRLGGLAIRGEPFFELIRPRDLRDAVVEIEGQDGTVHTRPLQPDAELRGTVRSEIIERRVDPKIERECVKRDEEGDCIERREVRIRCDELSVRVEPRILLLGQGGDRLYSHNVPYNASERYCEDQSSVPSSLEMANSMVDQMVDAIRRDLAPVESRRAIRVMESRRNLRREDRGAFREAVRATNSSIEVACAGFEALEATNPDHVSVLFNIGLCFESGGELDRAAEYYSRALTVDPGRDYPTSGLSRIRSREEAEELLAQRAAL